MTLEELKDRILKIMSESKKDYYVDLELQGIKETVGAVDNIVFPSLHIEYEESKNQLHKQRLLLWQEIKGLLRREG